MSLTTKFTKIEEKYLSTINLQRKRKLALRIARTLRSQIIQNTRFVVKTILEMVLPREKYE